MKDYTGMIRSLTLRIPRSQVPILTTSTSFLTSSIIVSPHPS
jgi:hypothetical protein